jgi:hypothetical protein
MHAADQMYIGNTLTNKILTKEDNDTLNDYLVHYKELSNLTNLAEQVPNPFIASNDSKTFDNIINCTSTNQVMNIPVLRPTNIENMKMKDL